MRGVKIPYEQNHKYVDNVEHKLCSDCQEWFKLTSDFYYKNKSSPDGFNPYCKECTKKRSTKWQQVDNREQFLENKFHYNKARRQTKYWQEIDRKHAKEQKESGYFKKYQQDNKEKIKGYNSNHMHKQHNISDEEWESCKLYFENSCAYCGISESDAKEQQGHSLHMEHAINKGANDLSNCIPSCRHCNSKKWTRDFEEWYTEDNENFSKERLDKIHNWLNRDYNLVD